MAENGSDLSTDQIEDVALVLRLRQRCKPP
jgi:hypothetical protein